LKYLPDSPGYPSIGMDEANPDGFRNLYYMEGSGWQSFDRGQLMVRIRIGAPIPAGPIDSGEVVPYTFHVHGNYPNPFNGATVIRLEISERSGVKLELFDTQGRRLLSRDLGVLNPGIRDIPFDAGSTGTGVYFIKVIAGKSEDVVKVVLAR
jgi:hypothetical protein